MARLAPSSYVILGLLERHGAATPYRLDRLIAGSIGYFWSFPRSQLYAEAARLARLGLVEEVREEHGRRRRVLSLNEAGRAELGRWLQEPVPVPTQIQDEGLLQLFFTRDGPEGGATVQRLAADQLAAHRVRLRSYEDLVESGALAEGSPQRATLELGLRFERLAVAFWAEVPLGASSPRG